MSMVSAQPGQTGTAEGVASATVIAPLRAVQEQDLSFGGVTASPSASGTVAVDPAGSVAYAGGAQHACPGTGATPCRAHPARFSVSGEEGRQYSIVLPDQVTARGQRTGALLVVADLVSRSHNRPDLPHSGVLDNYGKDRFTIGGNLTVPAGIRSDIFHADVSVSVHYN